MIKEKLEQIIHEEFGKVIQKIRLKDRAKILDYKVTEKQGIIEIKITQFKIQSKGMMKVMDDNYTFSSGYGCPHDYLEPICGFERGNPEIKKFRNKYLINNIEGPDNDCAHN
jgi:hypothetical protein